VAVRDVALAGVRDLLSAHQSLGVPAGLRERVEPGRGDVHGRQGLRRRGPHAGDEPVADQTPHDLVALATHPQPGPSWVVAWNWIRRWQVVCCFGLALLGECDVLADLADGPEDWLCEAALAGLVELARREPEAQSDVLNFVGGYLTESIDRGSALDRPQLSSECNLFLMVPGRPDHDAEAVRSILEQLEEH